MPAETASEQEEDSPPHPPIIAADQASTAATVLLDPKDVPADPPIVDEPTDALDLGKGKSTFKEPEPQLSPFPLEFGEPSGSSSSKTPSRSQPDSIVETGPTGSPSVAGSGSAPNPQQEFDDDIEHAPSSSATTSAEASSSRGPNTAKTTTQQGPPATEYYLKSIDWVDPATGKEKVVRIVTQNENGPCPLVALSNVLLFRGEIEIRPFDRPYVTYEYLAELLGDYLLNHAPTEPEPPKVNDALVKSGEGESASLEGMPKDDETTELKMYDYRYNLNAALSVIPNLQTGLDVNVRFTNPRAFEPTPELALFDAFNTDVVHGWLPDPQDEETYAVVATKAGSYNKAVELIVAGDCLGQGLVVESAGGSGSEIRKLSGEGKRLESRRNTWGVGGVTVKEALITSQFLDSTATQLTYFGLQFLMDLLPENHVCILFRNNHFSTLYKHPGTSSLYTLVTDAGFVNERAVVWESLRDIDQQAAEFYDGWFLKTEFRGTGSGDWVGLNGMNGGATGLEDEDYALALKLQRIENARVRQRRDRNGPTQAAQMIDLRAGGGMRTGVAGQGIGGLPPSNIGPAAKEIARREEKGKGRAVLAGEEDKNKKKDMCAVM